MNVSKEKHSNLGFAFLFSKHKSRFLWGMPSSHNQPALSTPSSCPLSGHSLCWALTKFRMIRWQWCGCSLLIVRAHSTSHNWSAKFCVQQCELWKKKAYFVFKTNGLADQFWLFGKRPDWFLEGVKTHVLTTTENTITYHNALCLSPQNFA